MPEISRFYGIIIMMFYNDHNPPHFHASYGEFKVVISIDEEIVSGYMPSRALKLIFEWMGKHKHELSSNWNKCQNGEAPSKIEPLKLESMKPIWITEAVYKDEFRVFLKFNDGKSGIVDLIDKLEGHIFEPLKDKTFFKNFKLNTWTLEWPNGADLAPEFLYDLISENEKVFSQK